MTRLEKLEALLARIQSRATAPRVKAPKSILRTAPFERPITRPVVTAAVVAPIIEAVAPVAPVTPGEIEIEEELTVAVPPEPAVETVSGEFEVAPVEMAPVEAAPVENPPIEIAPLEIAAAEGSEPEMLELEELGPADEIEPGEIVVEAAALHPREEPAPAPLDSHHEAQHEPHHPERSSEPPESGRELVAPPHESAKMAVAAPATPDPIGLDLHEDHEPPPESARNLRAAPAVPSTSDVLELEAPRHISAPPPPPRVSTPPPPRVSTPAPPRVSTPPPPRVSTPAPAAIELPMEAPAAPMRAAIAVELQAAGLQARPFEHVVVGIDADVIRAEVTPNDVAAFVGAVRAPRPQTFGALLDAALDL